MAHESDRRTMLNEAPIFVNSFNRGGSNILVNLLLSHPEVCYPSGETQRVFWGGARGEPRWRGLYKRCCYGYPLALWSRCRSLFSPHDLSPRPELPRPAMRYVDRVLYREKLAARGDRHNRFVGEGITYTDAQIARARLLCKNVNGLVFMTDNFAAMYPNATFFGLIRNGFALCEGYLRRGRTAEDSGRLYRVLVDKILRDADRLERYHVVRFEEVLRDPLAVAGSLYRRAGLDFDAVRQIRLRPKPTIRRSGEHRLDRGSGEEIVWYRKHEVPSHFRPDVDEVQASRLSAADRDAFLKVAGRTMEKLGYI